MQRTPRTRTRKAVALTDPKPEFVSIVRSGANMTPFRAMKSDDSQTEIHMNLKRKSDTHDIARLVFRGENFKDEAAVQAWLDAGGYEAVTIVRAEDGDDVSFSVTAEGAPTEGLSDIDLGTGVTASVFLKPVAAAKAAETAAATPSVDSQGSVITQENGEPVQPVAKTDDTPVVEALKTEGLEVLRVKFDEWDVQYSDELTFSDALADGFDGVPPGFGEVMTAVYAATRNAIIVGKPDLIPAIFSDAAALVQKLAQIFPADVPLSLDVLVALDDEKLSAYVIKEEGKEPVLDELRLRGDLFFPELALGDAPLVAMAQKAPVVEENVRQKRDMSYKRRNIVEKAASKPKATGTDQSNDNTAVQQGGSTDTTSSAGKSEDTLTQKQEQGTAVPAAPALTVEALTAAMTAAFAPVIKSVQEVGAAVQAQSVKTDEAITALTKKTDEAVAASEKAVAERQTRRAADGDEHEQGKPTPVEAKKAETTRVVREMGLRGALGMPRRRS